MMQIDINEILTEYKDKLSAANHENILLAAQNKSLVKEIAAIQETLKELESAKSDEETE